MRRLEDSARRNDEVSFASSIQLPKESASQSESITTSWSSTRPAGEGGRQGDAS